MPDTLLAPPIDLRCPVCRFVTLVRLEVDIEERFQQPGGDVIFFQVNDQEPARRCLRCNTNLLSWNGVHDQARSRVHIALGGRPLRTPPPPRAIIEVDASQIDRDWLLGLGLSRQFLLENKCLPVADWEEMVVVAHAPEVHGDEEADARYEAIIVAALERRLGREVVLQTATETDLYQAFKTLWDDMTPGDFWPD